MMKYSCGPLLAALAWGIEDVGPEFGAGDCAACAHADSLSSFGAWGEVSPWVVILAVERGCVQIRL
jgi:hypothetical protein